MKISALLSKEDKWTQNCLGRDKDGNPLYHFNTTYTTRYDKDGKISYQEFHYEDLAKSFSLYGAVAKCYSADSRQGALEKLHRAIQRITGREQFIATFNDNPDTSFEAVRSVVRAAGV